MMLNKHTNARTHAHVLPVQAETYTFSLFQLRLFFFGALSCGVVIGLSIALLVVSGGAA